MDEEESIKSDGICLPRKKLLHMMSPASLGIAEHLPASGKLWINSVLLCLSAWILFYLASCLYLSP